MAAAWLLSSSNLKTNTSFLKAVSVTSGTNLKKQINMVDRTAPSTFENKDKAIGTPSLATLEFFSELFGF
jgi:glutaredoxin-related protein